ncbi:MAG: TAXI family TRAP transporter solute-binding subunit [Giesbergeria sp.]
MLTKSLFENLPTMVAAHNAAKAIQRDTAMQGTTVPFHPGAEKYYREAGVLK